MIGPWTPPLQTCTKCKRSKPTSEFYKNSKTKTGFKARCKECCAAEVKRKKKTFINKDVTQEQETLANQRAIEKLIKKHPNEFHALLTQERTKL